MNKKSFSKAYLMPTVAVAILLLPTTEVTAQDGDTDLPQAGLAPGNWFYGLERGWENTRLFFANAEAKGQKQIDYAKERLAEARKLAKKEENQHLAKALDEYQRQLDQVSQNLSKTREDTLTRMVQATTKHQEILTRVQEQVPSEAQSSIEQARRVSLSGRKQSLDTLMQKNPPKGTDISIDTFKQDFNQMNQLPETQKSRLQTSLRQYTNQLQSIKQASQNNTDAAQEASTKTDELLIPLQSLTQKNTLSKEDRQEINTALKETSSTHINALQVFARQNPKKAAEEYRNSAQTLQTMYAQTSTDTQEDSTSDTSDAPQSLQSQEEIFKQYENFGQEISGIAKQIEENQENTQELINEARSLHEKSLKDIQNRVDRIRKRAQEQQEQTREIQREAQQQVEELRQEQREELQNELDTIPEVPETPEPAEPSNNSTQAPNQNQSSSQQQTQSGETSVDVESDTGETDFERNQLQNRSSSSQENAAGEDQSSPSDQGLNQNTTSQPSSTPEQNQQSSFEQNQSGDVSVDVESDAGETDFERDQLQNRSQQNDSLEPQL